MEILFIVAALVTILVGGLDLLDRDWLQKKS